MFDVLCAGQAVLDCITRGKESEPWKPNVYRSDTIRLHCGGDAVNESIALAGMGLRPAIACGLGRDIAGDILLGELTRAGVDTSRARRMPSDTPIANLMVAKDGSRVSVNSPATRLEGFCLESEDLAGARIVSLASLFRPPLSDLRRVRALICEAKAAGAIVCADTKLPLWDALKLDDLGDALPLIDYIFPNEKEAAYYTGESAFPEMARALTDRGIRNVIIKAGPEGCYVRGGKEAFALPAKPVKDVVDTTGAGDNFVAGFLRGVLEGASLRVCAVSGLEQAARAITHTGGGPSPRN